MAVYHAHANESLGKLKWCTPHKWLPSSGPSLIFFSLALFHACQSSTHIEED